jgi:hypothetical protein
VAAFPLRGALCELFEICPTTHELGREKKTAPFGKALVLTAATNLSRGSGGGFFTKLKMTD